MGNLNKKDIISKAEQILEKCEEKYRQEGKNKNKLRELERECKKLKQHNIAWKIILTLVTITFLLIII